MSKKPTSPRGLWQKIAGIFTPQTLRSLQIQAGNTQTNTQIPEGGLGNLRNLRVEDVAIPRVDIVAVPLEADLAKLTKIFQKSGHSRLPVYDENLDNPKGMVHIKDLALLYGFRTNPPKFDLKKTLRPLLFAPPSMPIGVLLQKMQTERLHLALVIDEYGGVDGLVTLEDLIEQVLGEIADEHDAKEDVLWVEESEGVFQVQARAPLDDFEKVLGVKLLDDDNDEDIDTLGGLAFMLAGHIPVRGEVLIHPLGYELEVMEADPRRIKRLRVSAPT